MLVLLLSLACAPRATPPPPLVVAVRVEGPDAQGLRHPDLPGERPRRLAAAAREQVRHPRTRRWPVPASRWLPVVSGALEDPEQLDRDAAHLAAWLGGQGHPGARVRWERVPLAPRREVVRFVVEPGACADLSLPAGDPCALADWRASRREAERQAVDAGLPEPQVTLERRGAEVRAVVEDPLVPGVRLTTGGHGNGHVGVVDLGVEGAARWRRLRLEGSLVGGYGASAWLLLDPDAPHGPTGAAHLRGRLGRAVALVSEVHAHSDLQIGFRDSEAAARVGVEARRSPRSSVEAGLGAEAWRWTPEVPGGVDWVALEGALLHPYVRADVRSRPALMDPAGEAWAEVGALAWSGGTWFRGEAELSGVLGVGSAAIAGRLYGAGSQGTGDSVPAARVWLGGNHGMRGWPARGAGSTVERLDPRPGGHLGLMASVEPRVRLHPDLVLHAFADVGQVWDEVDSARPRDIGLGLGFGGRLTTPIGRVRVEVAHGDGWMAHGAVERLWER